MSPFSRIGAPLHFISIQVSSTGDSIVHSPAPVEALTSQIESVVGAAQFNGLNLVNGSQAVAPLPVANLSQSMAFFGKLGFTFNQQFTDETAACMVWSEAIHVMLLTHDKWNSFTSRPIPPAGSSEVSLALSVDDRHAVDAMNEAAALHGGTADINPVQDHGFMYGRDLADPDGHIWGPFWMDPEAMAPGA